MADENLPMNWVDENVASVHSGDDIARSLSIEATMFSTKDYGVMGVEVTVDGVDDLPAAVAMMQAALDARPAEFQDPDESTTIPDMGEMEI